MFTIDLPIGEPEPAPEAIDSRTRL